MRKILILFSLILNNLISYSQSFEEMVVETNVQEGDASIISLTELGRDFHYISSTELNVKPMFISTGVILNKFDDFGSVIWRKTYYDAYDLNLRCFSINEEDEFIYLLCLSYLSPNAGSSCIILLKIDKSNGNLVNSYKYDSFSTNNTYGLSLIKTSDGSSDLIIAGMICSKVSNEPDGVHRRALAFRIKSSNGGVMWARTYGSPTHNYEDDNQNFYDFDRFNFGIPNTIDEKSFYCIGASTTISLLHPNSTTTFSEFYNSRILVKIRSTDGKIMWDKCNDSRVSLPIRGSKVIVDNQLVVSLGNYIEFMTLDIHDHNGNLINSIRIDDTYIVYSSGYNLMQDNDNYYITCYNNYTNNLIVVKIDKLSLNYTYSEFAYFNSNFNTQTVGDYFSNFEPFNINCYFQVNSAIKHGYINIASGLTTDGINFTKVLVNLATICTNQNISSVPSEIILNEIDLYNDSLEAPTVEDYQIITTENLYEITTCNANRPIKGGNEDYFESIAHEDQIYIFPNPVIDKLIIINSKGDAIEILNLYNQKISSNSYEITKVGENELNIDLSQFSKGIYYIKIGSKSYKVIKI